MVQLAKQGDVTGGACGYATGRQGSGIGTGRIRGKGEANLMMPVMNQDGLNLQVFTGVNF